MSASCRICGSRDMVPFLDLGEQPLANRLVAHEDLDKPEPRYPLVLEYCKGCSFVQLIHVVPPEEMFTDYPYATGTSSETRAHFEAMAEDVLRECDLAPKGAFVVDAGSNDGTLLGAFQRHGATVLGIEPAENLCRLANGAGHATMNAYFDGTAAMMAVRRHGRADVITAANVFSHVNDARGFLRTAKQILKPEGTLVLEVYYIYDLLRNLSWWQIYHEHLSYFSLRTLGLLLDQEGLEIWHVDKVPVQGGSLRVYVSRPGVRDEDNTVFSLAVSEPDTHNIPFLYQAFADKAKESRRQIRVFLGTAQASGKQIMGYAASAKASTLLNYCGLGPKYVEAIADKNPLKVGRYLPGVHIPIISPEILSQNPPDYLLVFSSNILNEIMGETAHLKETGTRYVVPLPKLVVI